MKFQFKIQQYQTDAVKSVVKIFAEQPFTERVSYVRDLGINNKPQAEQLTMFTDPESSEEDMTIGFENARLALSREQLLQNIRNMQTPDHEANLHGLRATECLHILTQRLDEVQNNSTSTDQ